jgi:hypothetical protein
MISSGGHRLVDNALARRARDMTHGTLSSFCAAGVTKESAGHSFMGFSYYSHRQYVL